MRGSAREAGLSSTNVYKRRAANDAFRSAWAEALREGYVLLETDLLDRALNGVNKDRLDRAGNKVGTTRERSDSLGLALLKQHRATVIGPVAPAGMSDKEAEAALIAQLAEMNRRLGGQG